MARVLSPTAGSRAVTLSGDPLRRAGRRLGSLGTAGRTARANCPGELPGRRVHVLGSGTCPVAIWRFLQHLLDEVGSQIRRQGGVDSGKQRRQALVRAVQTWGLFGRSRRSASPQAGWSSWRGRPTRHSVLGLALSAFRSTRSVNPITCGRKSRYLHELGETEFS